MGIKYNIEVIKLINLFEKESGVKVKDCLVNENIIFIVNKGYMGKAIGKKGNKIKEIQDMIKKKIKIVEFDDDVCKFVKNFLMPLKVESVYMSETSSNEKIVNVKVDGVGLKAKIIGRDNRNLKNLKSVILRYFKIDDVKVV